MSATDALPLSGPADTRRGTLRTPRLIRRRLRDLRIGRIVIGGRLADAGRLPRYIGFFLLGAALIWAPIIGYLRTAPLSFTSEMSLILPGSGASASVNLSEIGQASSFANSAFSSPSISPTVTYKRLLGADRIVDAAAFHADVSNKAFGAPRIELIDQTGLIKIAVTGGTAAQAQAKGEALLTAFFEELDALREDELDVREDSGLGAIAAYRDSVADTRQEISRLQRENGLISAGQYDSLVAETDALALEVQQTAARFEDRREAVASLASTLRLSPRLAAATLRLHADTEFSALVTELSTHAADYASARGQYGDRHPRVTAARDAGEAARAAALARADSITDLTDAELASLDMSPIGERAALLSDLVMAEAARAGTAAELAVGQLRLEDGRQRVAQLIEPAARLEDLQRDFQVAEAVFASALARAKSSRTDLYASYPLVQVLEDPSLPDGPSSPKTKLAIAAGVAALMMMFFGLLLSWVRSAMISRILRTGTATG
jgi:uncharacterized protein involved in exopolysaccharide biosynthesis